MKTILRPSRHTWRGGLQVGPDGRLHTTYTHNPATLRLASQNPNLQNLPRPNPSNPDALENLVRGLVTASPGWVIGAADFAGIEAVLVGYAARAPQYYRLARHDIHSFYTAYALYEVERRLSANDLPQVSWSDERLFGHLAAIKRTYAKERNSLYKHLVHACNFGQTPYGARRKIHEETGQAFDVALVTRVMHIYRELFPEIPAWQAAVREEAHDTGYLRNAFGYVLRVNHVFRYERTPTGQWERRLGDEAEAVLAFRPQSEAAGILKEVMLRLFEDHFEAAGQFLRLTTHDELWWECPPDQLDAVTRVVITEMERPVPQMPLPPEWEMGPAVSVRAEAKRGVRWSELS